MGRYQKTKMAFKFSSVIVCELPESYASSALGLTSAVDMTRARSQWRQYVSSLEGLGCKVTILLADEKFPDCVFVEDTAVIVLGHALLTKPGDPSRRDEIKNMKPVLEKQGLVVMEITDPDTKLDGGDVIFTGKEILVGLSSRTNQAGVDAISEAFPGFQLPESQCQAPFTLRPSSPCAPLTPSQSPPSQDTVSPCIRGFRNSPSLSTNVLRSLMTWQAMLFT